MTTSPIHDNFSVFTQNNDANSYYVSNIRAPSCADPESFARGDPTFFLIRGKRIEIALKADHHWPASKTPFK